MDIPHIQTVCGEYLGILRGILSAPQNIVMDLNNVMYVILPICIIMKTPYTIIMV